MKFTALATFSMILLITFPCYSQDARYQQFGSLFDGEENTHDELIKKGWIYLFDARVPSEKQAI